MHSIKTIIVLFCCCFFALPSFAQTQMEMNENALKDYKKADAELNRIYKELSAILGTKEKAALIKAQKAWLAYRDAHCAYTEGFYEGGSLQPLIYYSCLQEITEERVKYLKRSREEVVNR